MSQRLAGGEVSLNAPVGDNGKESYGAFLPAPIVAIDEQLSEKENRKLLLEKLKDIAWCKPRCSGAGN